MTNSPTTVGPSDSYTVTDRLSSPCSSCQRSASVGDVRW